MLFLKILKKLIKALESAASPKQIGWGFALGAILGLTPIFRLHNVVVIFLIFILQVNVSSALFSMALFKLLSLAAYPMFHFLGLFILIRLDFLGPFWTWLYNLPFAPLTYFNETVTMGGFIVSLVLLYPNYRLFRGLTEKYRACWQPAIQKWKIIKVLKGNRLVRFIRKIKNMGE